MCRVQILGCYLEGQGHRMTLQQNYFFVSNTYSGSFTRFYRLLFYQMSEVQIKKVLVSNIDLSIHLQSGLPFVCWSYLLWRWRNGLSRFWLIELSCHWRSGFLDIFKMSSPVIDGVACPHNGRLASAVIGCVISPVIGAGPLLTLTEWTTLSLTEWPFHSGWVDSPLLNGVTSTVRDIEASFVIDWVASSCRLASPFWWSYLPWHWGVVSPCFMSDLLLVH